MKIASPLVFLNRTPRTVSCPFGQVPLCSQYEKDLLFNLSFSLGKISAKGKISLNMNMKCIKAAFETVDSNGTQFNILEPLHNYKAFGLLLQIWKF